QANDASARNSFVDEPFPTGAALLASLAGRRGRGVILELDNLLFAGGIDDLNARQRSRPLVPIDLAWVRNHMIEAVERNLDKVVIGIVADAKQRQPFRLDLIA